MSKEVCIPQQTKAVSSTNVRIHSNRMLDEYVELYEEAHKERTPEPESLAGEAPAPIYRLDRIDRDQEVQDACQIYDLSQKTGFETSCKSMGIPMYAMTYLMDRLASGCSELSLRNYGIGAAGAVAVADLLVRNKTVKKLDLSLNNIQVRGTIAIAKLLEQNPLITELSISENNIGKQGVEAISNMIVVNDSLKYLDLSRNNLTDDDIRFFTNVMQTEDALEVLDLSHNKFGTRAGVYFGELIRRNCSLFELNLGWNHLGDLGAKEVSQALAENRHLEKLDLCWNEIGHQGAKDVGDALVNNSRLRELDLNNNHITDKGMQWLSRGLEQNDTLTVLRTGYNLITAEGACHLMRSVLKNIAGALEIVHLAEVEATKEFESLFWRVKLKRPRFNAVEMCSASGEIYHFVKPPNPLSVLDMYLLKNHLGVSRHQQPDEEGSRVSKE